MNTTRDLLHFFVRCNVHMVRRLWYLNFVADSDIWFYQLKSDAFFHCFDWKCDAVNVWNNDLLLCSLS
ncbi:Got1/Sft2-like vescicle transport protein family, partial [Zea mays]